MTHTIGLRSSRVEEPMIDVTVACPDGEARTGGRRISGIVDSCSGMGRTGVPVLRVSEGADRFCHPTF